MIDALEASWDIRIPADPQDKQTTDVRGAQPPTEFVVQKIAGVNTLTITDRQGPQDRLPTAAYRIYFIPAALIPVTATALTASARLAGQNIGSLFGTIPSNGKGTVLTLQDRLNTGKRGWYSCVGVNRVGTEAPPENVVVAP